MEKIPNRLYIPHRSLYPRKPELPHKNSTKSINLDNIYKNNTFLKPNNDKLYVRIWRKIVHTCNEYCRNSSMHGLKYIGDSNLTYLERFFWVIFYMISLSFSAYFIAMIFEKYRSSPVIIGLNPISVGIQEIPFPAITICNLNQAIKSEALKIRKNPQSFDNLILDDYCDVPNQNNSNNAQRLTWNYVKNFIKKMSQPCSEMFKYCQWKQSVVKCSDLFSTAITDDGLCCAFNRLPSNYTSRIKDDAEFEINKTAVDWNARTGYPSDSPKDALPLRPEGAGANMGLSVIVDAALKDFYCSSSFSVGFKVVVTNPLERPKMADIGFLIMPSVESRVVISPNIYDASDTLHKISVDKRQCYFLSEKYLKFYKSYTEINCKMECESNYTMQLCKCVPYFLPKEIFSPICGVTDKECMVNATELMAEEARENFDGVVCGCLPNCFEISYSQSLSIGMVTRDSVPQSMIGTTDWDYFLQNMALIRFYFIESRFKKYTKGELFGFTELLSNVGGLLGLFLGFSCISAIEIIYHITLRVYLNERRAKNGSKQKITPVQKITSKEIHSRTYYN